MAGDRRRGAGHVHDLPVHGDLASNLPGRRWAAGSGIDAAPFHRATVDHASQGREARRRWEDDADTAGPAVTEASG